MANINIGSLQGQSSGCTMDVQCRFLQLPAKALQSLRYLTEVSSTVLAWWGGARVDGCGLRPVVPPVNA
eukprot:15028477-Alexandrium_andersonii.AAC.1